MNRFHRWYCRTGRWRETVQQSLLPWVLRDADLGSHALEVGPGPGLTTDVLRTRVPSLTALEIDPALATSLRTRMAASTPPSIPKRSSRAERGFSFFGFTVSESSSA